MAFIALIAINIVGAVINMLIGGDIRSYILGIIVGAAGAAVII